MLPFAILLFFMFGSNCRWPNSSWDPINCYQWKSRLLWHLVLLYTAFSSTFWKPLRSVSTITPTEFHYQQLMCTVIGMLETSVSSLLHLMFGAWGLELGHHEVIGMLKKIQIIVLKYPCRFYSIFEDFHFNCVWETGICLLSGASRGKSVQLCVYTGSN